MTVAPERTSEQIGAEIEELQQRLADYSTAAIKSKLASLERELHAVSYVEVKSLDELKRELAAATEQLDALYADLTEKLVALNGVVDRIDSLRAETYEPTWRKAQAAGIEVPHRVPKLSVRAQRDRTLLNELHRMQRCARGDP